MPQSHILVLTHERIKENEKYKRDLTKVKHELTKTHAEILEMKTTPQPGKGKLVLVGYLIASIPNGTNGAVRMLANSKTTLTAKSVQLECGHHICEAKQFDLPSER